MKKLALVLVGVFTFSASSALAQTYSKTLCANGTVTANILATYIGSHSGRNVYSLNGWVQRADGHLSGTATIVPGSNNIHWAFTVHRAAAPPGSNLSEVWDFTTNLGLYGSGYYRTNDSALEDWLTITPGGCPGAACNNNLDCTSGSFCKKSIGDCNGTGTCTTIPELCLIYPDPVCGCDGITYNNECYAAWASISVLHNGECVTLGE